MNDIEKKKHNERMKRYNHKKKQIQSELNETLNDNFYEFKPYEFNIDNININNNELDYKTLFYQILDYNKYLSNEYQRKLTLINNLNKINFNSKIHSHKVSYNKKQKDILNDIEYEYNEKINSLINENDLLKEKLNSISQSNIQHIQPIQPIQPIQHIQHIQPIQNSNPFKNQSKSYNPFIK
jgi:hypothetical protein